MGLVVLGHGQDRDHSDRSLTVLDAAGAFVHRRQVRVEVARIAAPSRDLLTRGRDLAQGLGVEGHVDQDDQDVHVQVEGEVLGAGQGEPRRRDALDGRLVGQVEEQDGPLERPGVAEVLDEEIRLFEGDAHGAEDDREFSLPGQDLGLPGDLGGDPRMGQAARGEDRKLLAADERVHAVDRRNARLDELGGIIPGVGIDRASVDVEPFAGDDLRPLVLGPARSVEDPADDLLGHPELLGAAQEPDPGARDIQADRPFEDLDDGLLSGDVEDRAAADEAARGFDLDELAVLDVRDLLDDEQRSDDIGDGQVFLMHGASQSWIRRRFLKASSVSAATSRLPMSSSERNFILAIPSLVFRARIGSSSTPSSSARTAVRWK